VSGIEQSIIVALAAWVGLLTLTAALLSKQVVLLTARMATITDIAGGDVFLGLSVESSLNARVVAALDGVGAYAVVMLSQSCVACRTVAKGIPTWSSDIPVVVVIQSDSGDNEAAAELIASVGDRPVVLLGDEASRMAASIPAQQRPFGVIIVGARVVHAAPLSTPARFLAAWEDISEHAPVVESDAVAASDTLPVAQSKRGE